MVAVDTTAAVVVIDNALDAVGIPSRCGVAESAAPARGVSMMDRNSARFPTAPAPTASAPTAPAIPPPLIRLVDFMSPDPSLVGARRALGGGCEDGAGGMYFGPVVTLPRGASGPSRRGLGPGTDEPVNESMICVRLASYSACVSIPASRSRFRFARPAHRSPVADVALAGGGPGGGGGWALGRRGITGAPGARPGGANGAVAVGAGPAGLVRFPRVITSRTNAAT